MHIAHPVEVELKHSVVYEGLPSTVKIHAFKLGENRNTDIEKLVEEARKNGEESPSFTDVIRAAKSNQRAVFVATVPAGEHVGFGVIHLGENRAYFTGAFVSQNWRKKGLMNKLIEARIRWAVKHGRRIIEAHVLPTSENVVRNFEIAGVKFVETPRTAEDVALYGRNGKKFVIDLSDAQV